MPSILMHMFQMITLPFWAKPSPYRPFVDILENNNTLLDYVLKSKTTPLFIREWGEIRPQRIAKTVCSRVWRKVARIKMGSHEDHFSIERIHIAPLHVVPTYSLFIKETNVEVRRFFINLTPQTISTHIVLSIDLQKNFHPLSRFENYLCSLVKKNKSITEGKLSDVIKFVGADILKSIMSDANLSSFKELDSIWHTSFGVFSPSVNLQTELPELMKYQTVSKKAQLYRDEEDLKIIDSRRSIISLIPKEVYSAKRDQWRFRNMECHFNNWNDVLFLYWSTYSSLKAGRDFIHNGGSPSPEMRKRLLVYYDSYDDLRKESGWSEAIRLLEISHAGETQILALRDEIMPKGGVVEYISVTIGSGNNFYGPITVAKNIENSFNTAGTASNVEIKEALQKLTESITDLCKKVDTEEQETVSRKLNMLTEEAVAKNPDKSILKVTGEGLIDAAKTVAGLVGPVTTAVKGVLSLLGINL